MDGATIFGVGMKNYIGTYDKSVLDNLKQGR